MTQNESTKKNLGTSHLSVIGCAAHTSNRLLSLQQTGKDADYERHIATVKAQFASSEIQHKNELSQAQEAARSEVERIQLRAEAEAANLKASINRLEVDLIKVYHATLLWKFLV